MKRTLISLCLSLLATTLLTGCVLNLGGDGKTCHSQSPVTGQPAVAPTLGQQLMDLQKAKDAGAITDTEYQQQKAKLLESK